MENLELYLSIFASIASLLTYLRGENTRKLIVKSNSNKLTQSRGQNNNAYQSNGKLKVVNNIGIQVEEIDMRLSILRKEFDSLVKKGVNQWEQDLSHRLPPQ